MTDTQRTTSHPGHTIAGTLTHLVPSACCLTVSVHVHQIVGTRSDFQSCATLKSHHVKFTHQKESKQVLSWPCTLAAWDALQRKRLRSSFEDRAWAWSCCSMATDKLQLLVALHGESQWAEFHGPNANARHNSGLYNTNTQMHRGVDWMRRQFPCCGASGHWAHRIYTVTSEHIKVPQTICRVCLCALSAAYAPGHSSKIHAFIWSAHFTSYMHKQIIQCPKTRAKRCIFKTYTMANSMFFYDFKI